MMMISSAGSSAKLTGKLTHWNMKSKQQILETALLKAHGNGWEPLTTIDWKNVEIQQWQGNGMVGIALLYNDGTSAVHWVRELEGIIFNHDFAKALWGERRAQTSTDKSFDVHHPDGFVEHVFNAEVDYGLNSGWQYHLQQMVIAEDPIEYLGANI